MALRQFFHRIFSLIFVLMIGHLPFYFKSLFSLSNTRNLIDARRKIVNSMELTTLCDKIDYDLDELHS